MYLRKEIAAKGSCCVCTKCVLGHNAGDLTVHFNSMSRRTELYFFHNIFLRFQTFKAANRSTLAIAGNFSTEKGFAHSHSDIPILQ